MSVLHRFHCTPTGAGDDSDALTPVESAGVSLRAERFAVRHSSRRVVARLLLVVEDDRALSALLGDLFTAEGYRVDTAYDGQQGMHRGLTGNYDAPIVDRGLAVMDGADLIALLRARGSPPPH